MNLPERIELRRLERNPYYSEVRSIVEKYKDDNRDWEEWGFNDILNDSLLSFSTLHIEKKRIEQELKEFAA